MTIWYKEVDANTNYTTATIKDGWTEGVQVSYQQSSYSVATLQADGRIGFFFEEAPCYGDDYTKGYCMVYVPLTIEQITKGNYNTPEGETTAIHGVTVKHDGKVYDLSGRQVVRPTNGLYIIDGRKVYVKKHLRVYTHVKILWGRAHRASFPYSIMRFGLPNKSKWQYSYIDESYYKKYQSKLYISRSLIRILQRNLSISTISSCFVQTTLYGTD